MIGGGFYGCEIALLLRRYFKNVLILEENSQLCQRATYINQARIHNGYHYPRSFLTAFRSHHNFNKFIQDYKFCIDDSFQKIYGIARHGSKVTAKQFEQFITRVGAPLSSVSPQVESLFNQDLIEKLYLTQEVAFDAYKLKEMVASKLTKAGVKIYHNVTAAQVKSRKDGLEIITTAGERFKAKQVFNCTYARINTILKNSGLSLLPFKHELIEMALIEPPAEIRNLGITIMDGPFFSTMPFPSQKLHSLSHVRYTPITAWSDKENYLDPYQYLTAFSRRSRYQYMLKDAIRYLPVLSKAHYVKSLFEIKTVLLQNEDDDGRPILFRKDYDGLENFYLVMGGKIDNIYDILGKITSLFTD